ncbi:MAG TPA: sigma-70 family RNA polymerase sigma factor [Sphingomicrobium sp.]
MRFIARRATGDGSAPGRSTPSADQADEFRRLILPHLDGAYNLARYLTRDPTLSEDIVQDAMVRAFRAFAQLRGGSPRAWLFAIVRNCCRTAMAVSLTAHESEFCEEVAARADPSLTPEDEALRTSEIERVRLAIEAIPEPFREAVVLRDLEELSYAEIAAVTLVPIGTVMSRLARGRGMLAKELLPSNGTSDGQARSAS